MSTRDTDINVGEAFGIAGLTTIMAALIFGGMMLLMIPALLLQAWVITVVWGWFVVPLFHAPAIALPVAVGLSTLLNLFRPMNPSRSGKGEFTKTMTVIYITPLMNLGIAYVAHLYV